MWWIIGIAVVGFIIYSVNKDHKEHVQTHVTGFGGMQGKYGILIDYLKSGGLQVQKMTRDSVILSSNSMYWTLDYVGNDLEVRMKGYIPLLGNINKKWVFQDGYPQEKMLEEIENYLTWQMNQLKKAGENNPYEHLNNK
ncbi:MAG: hypothetical protein LBM07_02375 [Culturomica sp.]|nr:hypothetical protein [Culturomica sp.]